MANTTLDSLGFDDLQQRAKKQGEVLAERAKQQRAELTDRAESLRTRLTRQSQLALGQLRDGSLTLAYQTAATTLRAAGDVLGKTPVQPKPVAQSATRLKECAEHWSGRAAHIARPPVDDYDDLNVKEVRAAMDDLDFYQLEKLAAYEAAHKNRVTVLRDVERRLA